MRPRARGHMGGRDVPTTRPMAVVPIFDSRPHRNRGMPGIRKELKWPNDRLLISVLVAYGQPQWSAEQLRFHPPARFFAVKFLLDVMDAAEGDGAAKERVDYCRWSWQEMRKQEMISDIPNRGGQHLV
jgi:hypothetical protein